VVLETMYPFTEKRTGSGLGGIPDSPATIISSINLSISGYSSIRVFLQGRTFAHLEQVLFLRLRGMSFEYFNPVCMGAMD